MQRTSVLPQQFYLRQLSVLGPVVIAMERLADDIGDSGSNPILCVCFLRTLMVQPARFRARAPISRGGLLLSALSVAETSWRSQVTCISLSGSKTQITPLKRNIVNSSCLFGEKWDSNHGQEHGCLLPKTTESC